MTQLSNLKQDLETLGSSNVDFLKFNENGDTHEKVDKQAVLDKINRQNQMVSIVESLKEYTWEEKVEWMHQKKLKGNRLFNKKKYDDAIQTYLEALTGMDLNCAPEKKQRILSEVQIPCLLNIASCMKQKKEFYKGLDLCTKAIALNKGNPTAYMRRGMIYQAMKEYDKAINDYKTARNLGAEDTALGAISKAIQDSKAAQAKARKAYKGFFEEGGLSQDTTAATNDESQEQSTTTDDKKEGQDEENVKILYYNDDLEELSHYGVFKYVAYPIKKSLGYIKERTDCCRRRRNYEPLETDESFHP